MRSVPPAVAGGLIMALRYPPATAGGTDFLLSGYRIEEQRISRQRLATILGPKAEKDDAALAHAYFDQRSFAFDPLSAQQPTRE